jgi:HEAT repeat protein
MKDSPRLGGDRARSGDEPQLSTEQTLAAAFEALRRADLRHRALNALIRLGDAAVPALLDALHNPEREVRQAAAQALARVVDPRAARKLTRAADWTYRRLLPDAPPGALPDLLEAFEVGSRPTRAAVAVALGRLRDDRALPALLEALDGDSLLVRLAAVRALGVIAAPDAVPFLADALYDPEPAVSRLAAEALERIDTPEARTALSARDK